MPSGRTAPFSNAPLFRNKLRIILEEDGFTKTEVKWRASIFKAVSNGTNAPS